MADNQSPDDGSLDQDKLSAEWAAMADAPQDDAKVAEEWEKLAAEEPNPLGGAQADRVLDQNEIDSLLGFDGDDDDNRERTGIQALINSGLVAYERLPMLDIIFDRFVRMMSTSLRNFTSDNIEVSIDNTSSIRFGDYLNSIPDRKSVV